MIKFVSKDFKDIRIGSKQVVKVCQGIDVKWEKSMIKTISYKSEERIDNWRTDISVPTAVYNILKGKKLIELNVGGYKVKEGNFYLSGFTPKFNLSNSMMDLTGLSNWIQEGTEITIKYK